MDIYSDMPVNIDTLKITREILNLVAELDEFKGSWQAIDKLPPERLSALNQVATVESIGSSTRIEGSKLSDQQVAELLARLDTAALNSRDEQEAAGYADVMASVVTHATDIPLTENYIKQLHQQLLAHSSKDERHRGDYKKHPNPVSAFDADGKEIGIVLDTASPLATPQLMAELIEWTSDSLASKALHPLLTIGVFIAAFLEIHPFQDGNGRLSRILTNLLLLRSGYTYAQYSSLEKVIERSKAEYYRALRQTQETIHTPAPNWQPWIVYFLRSLRSQKNALQQKVEREQRLLERIPPLSLAIVELAAEHGSLNVGEIVELTGANRNTVKKHLQRLVSQAQLVQHGKGKGTRYGVR